MTIIPNQSKVVESSNSFLKRALRFVKRQPNQSSLSCCFRGGKFTCFRCFFPRKCVSVSRETVLLLLTISAVFAGIGIGGGLRSVDPPFSRRQLVYLKFPGELFLRMLKMCILPLIVSSLISSLASLDATKAGRLSLFTVGYYFTTTALAVVEGIILVLLIKPGNWVESHLELPQHTTYCMGRPVDTIMDLLRNIFPENLIEATTSTTKSCNRYFNNTDGGKEVPLTDVFQLDAENRSLLDDLPETSMTSGMNILGLIAFSVFFGVVVGRMGEKGLPLLHFFSAMEAAMMRLISLVIWYSPIGITFLIAAQITEMGDLKEELQRLAGYTITVLSDVVTCILGLFLHGLVILPAILFLIDRKNPIPFFRRNLQALVTALGTSSSNATLPLTMKCLIENNKIDPRIVRFMIPLGATINMDGTALYEAVAVLYIAQTVGVVLSIGDVIIVSLTATLASIGAAGIPQAGVVTMVMVLIAVGLPSKYFVLIMPVDWFLDRIRTMVNVHGDTIGAGVVQHFCAKQFEKQTDADSDVDKQEKDTTKAASSDYSLEISELGTYCPAKDETIV